MADELGRWAEPGLLVLASLADGEKHGYAITTDVAAEVGVTLGPGTLYAALARLEERGLIEGLPAATAAQAREIVDRMRLATPLGQTFSAGLAVWNGAEASDALTGRADAALYEAKNGGRNRIVEAIPAEGLALHRPA